MFKTSILNGSEPIIAMFKTTQTPEIQHTNTRTFFPIRALQKVNHTYATAKAAFLDSISRRPSLIKEVPVCDQPIQTIQSK